MDGAVSYRAETWTLTGDARWAEDNINGNVSGRIERTDDIAFYNNFIYYVSYFDTFANVTDQNVDTFAELMAARLLQL